MAGVPTSPPTTVPTFPVIVPERQNVQPARNNFMSLWIPTPPNVKAREEEEKKRQMQIEEIKRKQAGFGVESKSNLWLWVIGGIILLGLLKRG